MKCIECEGDCCKYVTVKRLYPKRDIDFEELKWFLCHKNVIVYIDYDNVLCVEFRTLCNFQDPKTNRCMIYKKRPKVCAKHNPKRCEVNVHGTYYRIMFRTVEDIDAFKKALRYFKLTRKKQIQDNLAKVIQRIEKTQRLQSK